MKKLSIITVCKNESQRIEKTLNSIFSQTFNDYEVIVIDGLSTDGTVEIIKKYTDKINKFISENDKGIYNAMNKGIGYATGQYCLFLNGGDYLLHDNVLANAFKEINNEDIIIGNIVYENDMNTPRFLFNENTVSPIHFLKGKCIPHQASFIKKKLFDNHGLYDEQYKVFSDYDFCIREICRFKVITKVIPITIAVMDINGVSLDPRLKKLNIKENLKVRKKYFNFILFYLYELRMIILVRTFKLRKMIKQFINWI